MRFGPRAPRCAKYCAGVGVRERAVSTVERRLFMKKLDFKLFAIIALPFCCATFFLFNHPGTAWGQFVVQQLGGIIVGSPSCVSTASDEVICAVRGADNNLFVIRF